MYHIHNLADLSDPSRVSASDRLRADFADHGFAVFGDNGLAPEVLSGLNQHLLAFFALNESHKRVYERADGGHQRGYTPPRTERAVGQPPEAADLKEFWQDGPPNWQALALQANLTTAWPAFDALRAQVYATMRSRIDLVLGIIAPMLGVTPDWLVRYSAGGDDIARFLHYFPQRWLECMPGTLRSAKHTDINLLTALLTQGPGLVVESTSGKHIALDIDARHLVIQTGDMIEVLSGGLLPATKHWVVNPDNPDSSRLSIALFNHPAPLRWVDVLPHLHRAGRVFDGRTERSYTEERLIEIGILTGPPQFAHERASSGYPVPPAPWPDYI